MHPWVDGDIAGLKNYLSRAWWEHFEEPERPEYLAQILAMIHAERTLLFSTDYPHWDNDFPNRTLTRLAPSLRQRIFFDNAADLFHLT